MNNKHNQAFGRVLKRLREARKQSQEQLGFDADLTRAYISLLERGHNSPTLDTIYAIAAALHTSAEDIFEQLVIEVADVKD